MKNFIEIEFFGNLNRINRENCLKMEMIYSGKTHEGILVLSFFDVDSEMKKSLIAVEVELRC